MRRPARLVMASALLSLVAAASSAQLIDPFNAAGVVGMAKAGNYAAAQDRLNLGDSPNMIGENGAPALTVAIQYGHCDIAKLLLEWHARTDIKDRLGNTALMYAAELGSLPCLEALIAAHADVNAPGAGGVTALMKAARGGKVDAVKELVQAKADVTATDFAGATALTYAENARQPRAAAALRAAGASK